LPDLRSTDYIKSNEIKAHFVHQVSENTGDLHAEKWLETVRANRQYVKQYGWACEAFQGTGRHKATVIMGASPAIKKQASQLRKLASDPDFILIGISSGLKFLAENWIKPRYCFVAEVQDVVLKWFEGVPEEFMKGITLIVDIHTNRKVMDVWKGDIKFLGTYSVVKSIDKKTRKWMYPVNGTDDFFPALGAQHGSATAFANLVLESPVVIFVGSEFGFPSNDTKDKYYVNRDDSKDHYERSAHTDIFGNVAYTTLFLLQNKYILEDWCGKMPQCAFFNATEAGILGVEGHGDTARQLPWIVPVHLSTAVKQARHILYYGEPITTDLKPPEQKLIRRDGVIAPFELRR
jgi:hypothetical protein